MSLPKKTWLRRKLDWLENHKVFGPILLLVFVLSVIGGFVSFANTSVSLVKMILGKETDEIIFTVEVQNIRSYAIGIDPVCNFEIVEEVRNSTTSYGGIGNKIRLIPIRPTSATNDFRFEPGENHDYQICLPKNQLILDLLATGTGNIKLTIWLNTGESIIASVPLQKEYMHNNKTVIKLTK